MKIRRIKIGRRNNDIVITILFVAVIFGVFHFFDAFEKIHALTRRHEDWELDEFVLLLLALPLPISWLAYCRSREAVREATRRRELEKRQAHWHKLESLGTLASGMAHEINNQLLPVTTVAEIVRDQMADSDPNRQKMDLIIASAANARNTVSKITAFSRMPEGHSGTCEVTKACRAAEDVLRATCPPNARLAFHVEEGIGTVNMAEDDLQGAVVNLFSNAVDALDVESGDVSVMVCATKLGGERDPCGLPAGNYAKVTVRDTGVGIAPDVVDRIFDPFFTTKVVGKGVGLGLAIVQNEVRRAGGDIRIESGQGQGTTIAIYLPIVANSPSTEPGEQVIG